MIATYATPRAGGAPDADRRRRADVLRRLGAAAPGLDALLEYTANPFDFSGPLVAGDEPCVSAWDDYLAASASEDVFPVLQRALYQLRFPVRAGIDETDAYRAATRRGDLSALGASGVYEGGLRLVAPERLRLELHPTPAGRIPVLTAPVRDDFVALVRALARRNAPVALPGSMGALMVSGYNNWDRVRRYREVWEATAAPGASWAEAFQRLIPQKALYQDRFVLLSEGPYSAVPAADLGLDEAAWLGLSHTIRKEHECAHYYCKRVLGAMRYHVFDEVIADAYAIVAATGGYRAGWLLRFLGLDHEDLLPREGSRMWNYCDGLARDEVGVVAGWVRAAARRLGAELDGTLVGDTSAAGRGRLIRAIAATVLAGDGDA